jgi:8-oxo-dGTP pyrophosphatase MutT (NUDIX family)
VRAASKRLSYDGQMNCEVGGAGQNHIEGAQEVEALRWVQHGERTIYDNPWVRLSLVDVTPPDGKRFEHHVVRLNRVVMTCVVDADQRVLLLWRHRFVDDAWGWELPGGIVEVGEDSIAAAERETVEETGWRPNRLIRIAEFQPMPGMVDTPHELFYSAGAERLGEPTDEEEVSVLKWMPLSSVPALIDQGLIAGAGSLIGLLRILGGGPWQPEVV